MVRQYIRDYPARWRALSDAKKAKWLGQLEDAGNTAHAIMMDPGAPASPGEEGESISAQENAVKLEAARVVVQVVRTATLIERQNQIEQIKQAEWDRLDKGGVTGRTEHTGGITIGALIAANPDAIEAIEAAAVEANRRLEAPPGGQGAT